MDDATRKTLERPFPGNKVKSKKGQGGRQMSYISHGLVTERLTEADPEWESRRVATHTYVGSDGRLHCEGVEIELTVGGVTRVESGGPQRQDGFANEIKNAYSDALKRAAMRFGVALSMWERLIDAEYDEDVHPDYEPPRPATPAQQAARAREVETDAKRRFHATDDVDEKIAAGAVAVVARETRKVIEQRPVPPSQTNATPPLKAGVINDWSSFWKLVRPLGYQTAKDIEAKAGFSIAAMSPQQALDAMDNVLNPKPPAPA